MSGRLVDENAATALVTRDPPRYGPAMFARIATVALLATIGLNTASAEVVLLKEKASVSGKILAEKRDSVIVDLGYTVLTIPRAQIARILKEEEEKVEATPPAAALEQ